MAIEDLDTKAELGRFITEYLEGEPLPLSAITGLQTAITAGTWQRFNLEGGWANHGEGFSAAAWRTLPGSLIQLRGLVVHATEVGGSSTIARLPAGARPKESSMFVAEGSMFGGDHCRVDVNPDGAITALGTGTATYLSISQIIFAAGT